MDLVLEPQSRGTSRARLWVIVAVVVTLVAACALAYIAGREHAVGHPPASLDDGGGPADITWSAAGPWPVPRSATAGPTATAGGVATGYAHTALGVGVAAWNIVEQMSSDAGPAIYTATLREQTYGDPATMLAWIARSPTGGSSPGTAFFYKIAYGDPTGTDPVLVWLAERTPDSAQQGGYYGAYRSMRWLNGDWRMQVPLTAPALISDVTGFQALGGPGV